MSSLLLISAAALDQLLTGCIVGVTVWFFFIQSPFLFNLMGKENFVPIMMQMTRLWVSTIFYTASAVVTVAMGRIHFGNDDGTSIRPLLPILGWAAIAINKFFIVPKALKAGARSHNERKGDNTKDVKEFFVAGGGKSETQALHQTVVVFVLIMTVSFVLHLIDSVGSGL